jgi:hypothetical protein
MRLLIIGAGTICIFWLAAWTRLGLISEYSFFPLWAGHIVFINGLSEWFFRTSLLKRMGWTFIFLFVISIPMWWFFEYMNSIVHNWHYVLSAPITAFHYEIQASINFSTVIPAVLSTAFFVFNCVRRDALSLDKQRISSTAVAIAFVMSFILFGLMAALPNETFPLVWIIPLLFLEPLNYRFNADASFLGLVGQGDWTFPISIGLGTLTIGFWWECWNVYSLPKWVYTIPYVGFWKIFEMPFLGYFGYPFFGLIVFSYASLLLSLVGSDNLVRLFYAPR